MFAPPPAPVYDLASLLFERTPAGDFMPYVNIQITSGTTRDQKRELVRETTDSLVRILGKRPEHIHIVIQEIAEENWGFSGMLTDEWRAQQQG